MKTMRREFSAALELAIIRRATDDAGLVHCEKCGAWLKSREDFEIDHVVSEGIRPEVDKAHKLKAADGQLLCRPCHRKKTPADQNDIARAKRREAKAPMRVAAGEPALMRRGFVPAGGKE